MIVGVGKSMFGMLFELFDVVKQVESEMLCLWV